MKIFHYQNCLFFLFLSLFFLNSNSVLVTSLWLLSSSVNGKWVTQAYSFFIFYYLFKRSSWYVRTSLYSKSFLFHVSLNSWHRQTVEDVGEQRDETIKNAAWAAHLSWTRCQVAPFANTLFSASSSLRGSLGDGSRVESTLCKEDKNMHSHPCLKWNSDSPSSSKNFLISRNIQMFFDGLTVKEWKGELDIIQRKTVSKEKLKIITFVIHNRLHLF